MTATTSRNARIAKRCAVCASEFVAKSNKRVYCSDDCKTVKRREYARERYMLGAGYLDQTRDCDICGNQFKPSAIDHRLCSQRCRASADRFRRYGITSADYQQMLEQQNHRCAACHDELADPHIDHSHTTGNVRQLLCKNCNLAIGYLQEDTERSHQAAVYIARHTFDIRNLLTA